MDISADKVYNTNQTDAPKKILMGMQIEDLPSSTFLYYYSLTSDLENINLNSPLQVVVHDTEQHTNLYPVRYQIKKIRGVTSTRLIIPYNF
jgi:hypothetical protein